MDTIRGNTVLKKLREFSTVCADRAIVGSTEISAVKAKVCLPLRVFFHIFMGKKAKKKKFL